MLKIGNLELDNRILQAPMAGITDYAFRVIAREMGAALTWSEMINDKGLLYGQMKTEKMFRMDNSVRPMAVQIFGNTPAIMAEAAHIIEEFGADVVDINMGCPAPKIVKNNEGSALMKNLSLCREIIREVRKTIKIPLTVKMRRGFENEENTCLLLAKIAEEEGANAVIVHPRSRMQFFSGHSNWDLIREVKKTLSIPVIGNGDIWTAEDAVRMINETDCDGVMLARGTLGNPFLFREVISLVEKGKVIAPPTVEERMDMAIRNLELAISDKGEFTAIREQRKQISWYIKGLRGASKIREEVNKATTLEDMKAILNYCKKKMPTGTFSYSKELNLNY